MSTTRKAYVLGGSAAALLVIGLAASRGALCARPIPAAQVAATAPATGTEAAPARPAAPTRQWKVGAAYVYAVESERAFTVAQEQGAGREIGGALEGELAVAVVSVTPEAVRLRAQLRKPRHHEANEVKLDEASLGKAFYLEARPSGELGAAWFARGTSSFTRGMLEGLATSLQVADGGAATTWRATEHDTTGEYEAVYRRDGSRIRKTKERYLRTLGPHGLLPLRDPSRYAVEASVDLTLDATGWPGTLTEDETIHVKAGGARVVTRTRTKATLVAVEALSGLAALVAAEEGSLEPARAGDAEGFAEARRQADQNLVGGASFRTVIEGLRAEDVHVKNHSIGKMAALLRLSPGQAASAADAVLHGDLDEDGTRRLIGALGSAGTKEAQQALVSVLKEANAAPATRSAAAAALGMSASPTPENEDALVQAMASPDAAVAGSATLGAGNLVKRMNDAQSGDPTDAVTALVAKLAAATSDADRALCLAALGNTGDPRALTAIEPYLASEDAALRAAAVSALKFMSDARVTAELCAAMADKDVKVRRAAVGTLPFRPITPMLATVEHVLETDPDVTVRTEIVTAMTVRKGDEPALTAALTWAAENDPSPQIRAAAKSALGTQ